LSGCPLFRRRPIDIHYKTVKQVPRSEIFMNCLGTEKKTNSSRVFS